MQLKVARSGWWQIGFITSGYLREHSTHCIPNQPLVEPPPTEKCEQGYKKKTSNFTAHISDCERRVVALLEKEEAFFVPPRALSLSLWTKPRWRCRTWRHDEDAAAAVAVIKDLSSARFLLLCSSQLTSSSCCVFHL